MSTTRNQLLNITPAYNDKFESNYYGSGSTIIVQTIEEYLGNIPKPIRKIGKMVSILVESGVYNISDFINTSFTVKKYEFIGGVDDNNFNEITYNLDGVKIVSLLERLDDLKKLQSAAIMYDTRTVKEVLDDILNINSGLLLVTCMDSNRPLSMPLTIKNSNNEIVVQNSTNNITGQLLSGLDIGKYNLIIQLGYYVINNVSVIIDNNMSDNTIIGNTISNIDVGYYRSEILFNLIPDEIPTFNSFVVVDGTGTVANKTFPITLFYAGVAYQYMISRSNIFENEVWQNLDTYISPKIVNYTYNFVNDSDATIYIKLKNSKGESIVLSQLVHFINPLIRSDSDKGYSSLNEILNDLMLDYPSGLTQNVEITCKSTYIETSGFGFLTSFSNFNKNTNYVLTIDGKDLYTINCHTDGGIYIENCDNIIIKNIKFTDVSSTYLTGNPEQMFAIKVKGFSDNYCNNIVITNININGNTVVGTVNHLGWYGINLQYINNVTLNNITITNVGAIGILANNINILSINDLDMQLCNVVRGVTSQPCLINISSSKIISIKDSYLDCSANDTIFIGSSVDYIYAERTVFKNAMSEIFRLSHGVSTKVVSLDSCLLVDSVNNPIYEWTKYYISLGSTNSFIIKNSTIRLIARGYEQYYARFVVGDVNSIKIYNNIFDTYMPFFQNNASDACWFAIGKLNELFSDYNVWRDYKVNDSSYSNRMFSTSGNIQLNTSDSANLTGLGYDVHSTFLGLTDTLFINSNFSLLSSNVITLPVSSGSTANWDINKKENITHNVGCYGQNTTDTTGNYIYKGNTTQNSNEFNNDSQVVIYSNNYMYLRIDSPNKNFVSKVIVTDDDNNIKTFIGNCAYQYLVSKNDPQTDQYIQDMYYDVEIIDLV